VSAQLGHANPATTLRYYARWIPSKGRRWADLLDRVTDFLGSKHGTKKWNQNEIGHSSAPEVADSIGGPSRTRTLDPLIKSRVQKCTQRNARHHDVGNPEASARMRTPPRAWSSSVYGTSVAPPLGLGALELRRQRGRHCRPRAGQILPSHVAVSDRPHRDVRSDAKRQSEEHRDAVSPPEPGNAPDGSSA
jgi:hypothetical protein